MFYSITVLHRPEGVANWVYHMLSFTVYFLWPTALQTEYALQVNNEVGYEWKDGEEKVLWLSSDFTEPSDRCAVANAKWFYKWPSIYFNAMAPPTYSQARLEDSTYIQGQAHGRSSCALPRSIIGRPYNLWLLYGAQSRDSMPTLLSCIH